METAQNWARSVNYTGNDDLFPSEVVFANGCKVCLACSEDAKLYLRVVND